MKYCTHCGTQLGDDDAFCTNCGNIASKIESQTQTVNSTITTEDSFNNEQSENVLNVCEKRKHKLLNRKSLITIISIILCIAIIAIICLKTIPYKCFDMKDDELFDILNELGVYVSHSSLDIDNIPSDATVYKITYKNETGVLLLSHSFSGHIRCIAIVMEDLLRSLAITSAIGSELDYSFYSDNIISSLLDNRIYSSNKYSIITVNLSSDISGIALAPKEHFEYCIESLFPD